MNFSTWWETTGKKLYQEYKDKLPEEDAVKSTAYTAHNQGMCFMLGIVKQEIHKTQTD